MVNLKINVERFVIIMLLLIAIIITIGCKTKIYASNKSLDTSNLRYTTFKIPSLINEMNIVVVRKNELLLVSLNDKSENIVLDSIGSFSRPLISPNKKYVSYLKDKVLYITTDKLKHLKVSENISELSFSWQDKNTLLYSPISGGLYVYDVINKTSIPYLNNEYNYQNITLNNKGEIYAEQYLFYKKNGYDYRDDFGILFFNPFTKCKKIVVKSIPSKIDTGGDLGMYPIITGISNDNNYIYIWEHPHAGSLAADGVPLAVYDILRNKLIEYTNPKIISLAYKDNLFPNPKNSKYLTLIYGEGRFMGNNKNLIVLDILTGKFQSISPKGQTSMTPFYLNDGQKILYASSKEQKNTAGDLNLWLSSGNHHIFSISPTTKQINQLTSNPNYFDFSPTYINTTPLNMVNNHFLFFRSDKTENVSIWKYDDGHETLLANGLIFYDDMNYPIQNYYGHFNTDLFTNIR